MKNPNPDLINQIKNATLKLLAEKEPEEISMREIAGNCGIAATTLYYYFRDRERLFQAVKKECLESMDRFIARRIGAQGNRNPANALRTTLKAIRDWAFRNPGIALLIMDRSKPITDPESPEAAQNYKTILLGKTFLDKAVSAGQAKSRDTLMDSSLCIAALWGAIESALTNRTAPQYRDMGLRFTNRMINFCCRAMRMPR